MFQILRVEKLIGMLIFFSSEGLNVCYYKKKKISVIAIDYNREYYITLILLYNLFLILCLIMFEFTNNF